MEPIPNCPSDQTISTMSFDQMDKIISDVLSSAQGLKDLTDQLPVINDNQDSKVFAEAAYAKKEEYAEQLKLKIQTLDRMRMYLEHRKNNIQNNMQVVSANQIAISGERPRKQFSDAEADLANQYKAAVKLLDKVKKVFDLSYRVLAEAYGKQFPGGLPRKDPKLFVNPFDKLESEEKKKTRDVLNREIANILGM